MDLQTQSFESPVSQMSDDLLDRWRLAKDVYAVISETPKDWSCRIGIYGKWGDGKTSLLKFVETQADSDGLISFWVNPSQADSADSLWRVVLEAFIDALEQQDVLLDEVRAWRIRLLADKTEPADKLAELNKYTKALVGFGRSAIKEWLKPDGEQLRALRAKLHSKRILVFIDDLDRTDPKLVPTLLLGLRELLDLPGFCFVLAFDDEIVSDSLMQVNKAWGDGKAFLDKILDFSFTLPKPTADQRLDLLKHHIRSMCDWMDVEVVEQNSDLLPETPRKLKALLRNLMTLAPRIRRHDPAEVQWTDLFLGQLIRVEAPGFMENFLKDDNEGLVQIRAYLPRRKDEPPYQEKIDSAVKVSGVLGDAVRDRVTKILAAWSERRAFMGSKNFTYYATFGSTCIEITYREFETLIDVYGRHHDRNALDTQLINHARLITSPVRDVAEGFLQLAVETRNERLEMAADAEREPDTTEFLSQAGVLADLVGTILATPAPPFDLKPAFRGTLIQSLVAQALRWIHFDRGVHMKARQQERAMLIGLANQDTLSGLDWLEFLTPWKDSTLYGSAEGRVSGAQLVADLISLVQDRVKEETLQLFSKGRPLQFDGPKVTAAVRFCFFDPKSPLWEQPGLQQFFDVLATAARNAKVWENASELLARLSWSRPRAGSGGNKENWEEILRLPGVAKALWTASTAQRLHYRFQQRLLETRTALLRMKIPPDQLQIPEWLAERERELAAPVKVAGTASNDEEVSDIEASDDPL